MGREPWRSFNALLIESEVLLRLSLPARWLATCSRRPLACFDVESTRASIPQAAEAGEKAARGMTLLLGIMNAHRPPDAKVIFRLTRDRPVQSGYRPAYDIRADYWTSTFHEFLDTDEVATGTEAPAHVWFLTPEVYPHTLWVGRVLTAAEGSKPVATATILEIFNRLLERDDA